MKKTHDPKRICRKCGKVIKNGEDFIALVPNKEWNPFESYYNLLTKPHNWVYYHRNEN